MEARIQGVLKYGQNDEGAAVNRPSPSHRQYPILDQLVLVMATFYANPNEENEPWIEHAAIEGFGFRNWHLMFFSFSGVLTLLVLICCCVRFRIPRTKQDIEGDFRRKKLAEKFQERLRLIQNQTNMDTLDLEQALKIIQEDYEKENKRIDDKVALNLYPDEKRQDEPPATYFAQNEMQHPSKFAQKFANIMLASTVRSSAGENIQI